MHRLFLCPFSEHSSQPGENLRIWTWVSNHAQRTGVKQERFTAVASFGMGYI